MTYNGYVADLFFNACAIVMWAAFLWRVLDGPRFRVWVTVLLAALIGAAYMAATLLLTTVGQLRALMFPVCSLAMAFLLFRGTPGRKLLAVAAELAGSLLMEMMFTPLMIDLKANDDISVWADPRAVIYGVTFLPVLGLGLMLISFIFTRSKNNLSGRQLLVFSAFPITQMVCEASLVTLMFTPPRYEYIPMQLTMSVLFLVSDILLYRTMVRTEQRVQLEVENALLESQLDAQLAHYRDLTAQYEQIRAMRHDISHHLNTIHALLQAGNLQAASEYSEQLLPADVQLPPRRLPQPGRGRVFVYPGAGCAGQGRPGAGGRVAAGGAAGVEHRPHRRLRQPARQRLGSLQRHSGRGDHAARAHG